MAGRHKAPRGRRARSDAPHVDAPVSPPPTPEYGAPAPPEYVAPALPDQHTPGPPDHYAPSPPWAGASPPHPPAPPVAHEPAPETAAITVTVTDDRRASWWTTMTAATGIALVAVVLGVVLTITDVVVDWREPVAGGALVLAPFLVWQVVNRVHRRWLAFGAAYVALLVLGSGIALLGDLVIPHTAAGFAAAAVSVVGGGVAFVLTSRLSLGRRSQEPSQDGRHEQVESTAFEAPQAQRETTPPPFGEVHWQQPPPTGRAPDESDTDLLPRVLPTERRNEREDDSLAG
ncbi:MAG: hypothetical protein GEV10_10850 [Streptosporangiales bacterium]|nr:hypothetical protein [Streptosporangiales bacterium]